MYFWAVDLIQGDCHIHPVGPRPIYAYPYLSYFDSFDLMSTMLPSFPTNSANLFVTEIVLGGGEAWT